MPRVARSKADSAVIERALRRPAEAVFSRALLLRKAKRETTHRHDAKRLIPSTSNLTMWGLEAWVVPAKGGTLGTTRRRHEAGWSCRHRSVIRSGDRWHFADRLRIYASLASILTAKRTQQ